MPPSSRSRFRINVLHVHSMGMGFRNSQHDCALSFLPVPAAGRQTAADMFNNPENRGTVSLRHALAISARFFFFARGGYPQRRPRCSHQCGRRSSRKAKAGRKGLSMIEGMPPRPQKTIGFIFDAEFAPANSSSKSNWVDVSSSAELPGPGVPCG